MNPLPDQQDFLDAELRIHNHIRETPVERSAWLSEACSGDVFLKLENYQVTGSFKIRGVMNTLLSMSDDDRGRGVVAASTGNHGAAVAYGMKTLNCPGIIFVPENAEPVKLDAIRALGGEVRIHGEDCVIAEGFARRYAMQEGMTYISPYNDPDVILGQGTIGVELQRQLDRIDVIYIAVGGGGLLSGIAGYLKQVQPDLEVVGCSPENSPVLCRSLEAGRVLDMESAPTLSDGTAGGMEKDAITFERCQTLINRFVLVTEEEIAGGVRQILQRHHMLIEGAAGVAIAACIQEKDRLRGKRIAIVLCGANISAEKLHQILSAHVD
ncbi:MAG: threonine/serine dehydratase [Planctomycetes bacterium]|nr:threonine/serine dehydratase [Planctomycetota bacterium]